MRHLHVWDGLHPGHRGGLPGHAAQVPPGDTGDGPEGEVDGEAGRRSVESGCAAFVTGRNGHRHFAGPWHM